MRRRTKPQHNNATKRHQGGRRKTMTARTFAVTLLTQKEIPPPRLASLVQLMQLLIALSSTGKDLLVTCEDADSAFALLCLAKDITEHLVARHRSDVVGVCNDVFSALCTLCDSITLLRDGVSSATLLDLRSVLFLSAIDNLTTFTKSLPSNPNTHLLMPSLVRFLYKHGTHLAKNSRTGLGHPSGNSPRNIQCSHSPDVQGQAQLSRLRNAHNHKRGPLHHRFLLRHGLPDNLPYEAGRSQRVPGYH